jgi:hypothetical protein
LRAIHQEQDEGQLITEQQTVAQWLERWLETYVASRRRPNTIDSYRQVIRLYLAPHLGKMQLAKLTSEHIKTMVNVLLKELSPRTVQYARPCCLAHEFGHYGLYLYDEYFAFVRDAQGNVIGERPAACTGLGNRNSATAAVNASVMDYQYASSELAMRDVPGL